MPVNSLIIGVDLSPIKPIPKVITFQSDITTEQCRATIRKHLKTWKADTVLHDGAPNVGTAWVQDSFNQAELVLQSMKLATDFLVEGGTFVTKVFRSKDYNSLLWVFNQLFTKVEATKPPSSRNVSAEIFVVCRGFKAPKHIDPKFLDPRAVFEELAAPTPNNEAKVYNPEVKKRKREGYEEGDWTQFKEVPASEFIQTTDPIAILGSKNRLHFDQSKNGDVALAALNKLPETTDEIRRCCDDLKILGKKEFKLLLKWRLKVREKFGFPTKKSKQEPELAEETAEVEDMDEEMRIQEELQALKEKEGARKKKERRKENEQRQKDIVRMQLNMTAPMDIGMEERGPMGEDAMFQLKAVDKAGALGRISKGKMVKLSEQDARKDRDSGLGTSADSDEDSDEEEDRLERELDGMYDAYKERKAATDAKYRAKRSKKEHGDDEWEGVSADEKEASDEESELEEDSDEGSEAEDDGTNSKKTLLSDLEKDAADSSGLSKRARAFFNQDLFKDMEGLLDEPEDESMDKEEVGEADVDMADEVSSDEDTAADGSKTKAVVAVDAYDDEGEEFEVVKPAPKKSLGQDEEDESDWEEEERRERRARDNRPGRIFISASHTTHARGWTRADTRFTEIDIITAEAMTLAHELATGKKSSHDLVDDGFNKHAFRADRDGLPDWFTEDESKHDRQQKPITKAAAAAIKEKLRAYNARPIKKVREAKARKKLRAADRLEKLKKKSDVLAASEGMTEKEKADSISKLISKANKKVRRPPVKVVVAKGANKGKGRPKGVKGRYKMVDSRMKKEVRALKRKAKSKK
jgi:AdoMet-dependent rRNA methyltransferase SPB1